MLKTKNKVIKKIENLASEQNISITVQNKEKAKDGIVYTILFQNDTILEIYFVEDKIKIVYVITKNKEGKVSMFQTKSTDLESIMQDVRYAREMI